MANVLAVTGGHIDRAERVGQNAVSSDIADLFGLTADNTTMWMSFLFVDNGFSGPTSSVMLASEDQAVGDGHPLSAAGYGVGVAIRDTGDMNRAPHTAYYNGGTSYTTVAGPDTFRVTGGPEGDVFMYAINVNWNADGTDDEIFLFEIDDLSTEPAEIDAIASDTFNMLLVNQQSIDVLNIGETQVDSFDEIRVGTTYADVTPFTAVPEPGSLAVLGLGSVMMLVRRRRG